MSTSQDHAPEPAMDAQDRAPTEEFLRFSEARLQTLRKEVALLDETIAEYKTMKALLQTGQALNSHFRTMLDVREEQV